MANQFLRPISDITAISDPWPGTPWWSKVDETSPDDVDYAESVNVGSSAMKVKLGPGFDPGVHTGHIVRVRAWQPSGTPNTGNILVYSPVGGEIADFPLPGNWSATPATITNTLSAGQAALITDYTDIYVQVFTFNGFVRCSWIEMELPEASPIDALLSDALELSLDADAAKTVQPALADAVTLSVLAPGLNDPERLIDAGRMFRVKRTRFSPGARSVLADFEDL